MKQDDDLDTILGYQMQRAYQAMTTDARRVLDAVGLTPATLTALLMIRSNPGCDQSTLGRALNINRSSAMKLVNGLVAQGFIERRAGRDLRSNALHLFSDGAAQVKKVVTVLRESDARMSERMSEAERTTLFKLLRKIGPSRAPRDVTPDG